MKTTIKSIDQLKQLTKNKNLECIILLNYGIGSWKTIKYNPKKDIFNITNHIDNSKQILTPKQLDTKSYTIIGEAIKKNALVYKNNQQK